ncbi:MAG: PAS domain-containing protein, partial [Prochlorothrix sp.]
RPFYSYPLTYFNESGMLPEARIVALPDAEAMVIIRDITDRKQAEQEIQEQRRFLRCILDTDPNFIFVKDRSGKFVLANQALANFYNTTIEAIIGKTSADFYTEPGASHFRRNSQMGGTA